jgi:hypothetical protein
MNAKKEEEVITLKINLYNSLCFFYQTLQSLT